jgi:hypothetical protein
LIVAEEIELRAVWRCLMRSLLNWQPLAIVVANKAEGWQSFAEGSP